MSDMYSKSKTQKKFYNNFDTKIYICFYKKKKILKHDASISKKKKKKNSGMIFQPSY